MGQKATKELHESEELLTWGASREVQGGGGAQCHILGQSVPTSTIAVEGVSPVKGKAGRLQTLVQVCIITG